MWRKLLKRLNLAESYFSITLGFLVIIVGGLLLYNSINKARQPEQPLEEEKLEEKEEENIQTLPRTHIVAANENLWIIAEKYYQSGYNWVSIAKENNLSNPNIILVGQTLTIPKVEIIKPESEKIIATATGSATSYTVVKGDNLWNIATREYNNGFAWTKIAKANNLANPSIIHAGNVLKLPR